jgi:hypothetical protein
MSAGCDEEPGAPSSSQGSGAPAGSAFLFSCRTTVSGVTASSCSDTYGTKAFAAEVAPAKSVCLNPPSASPCEREGIVGTCASRTTVGAEFFVTKTHYYGFDASAVSDLRQVCPTTGADAKWETADGSSSAAVGDAGLGTAPRRRFQAPRGKPDKNCFQAAQLNAGQAGVGGPNVFPGGSPDVGLGNDCQIEVSGGGEAAKKMRCNLGRAFDLEGALHNDIVDPTFLLASFAPEVPPDENNHWTVNFSLFVNAPGGLKIGTFTRNTDQLSVEANFSTFDAAGKEAERWTCGNEDYGQVESGTFSLKIDSVKTFCEGPDQVDNYYWLWALHGSFHGECTADSGTVPPRVFDVTF